MRSSDDAFTPETRSGSWVQLQDADGTVLYTRGVHELVPEKLEVPDPDGSFTNSAYCLNNGVIRLSPFPNDASATDVVFFPEPFDGELTNETVELAQFPLP